MTERNATWWTCHDTSLVVRRVVAGKLDEATTLGGWETPSYLDRSLCSSASGTRPATSAQINYSRGRC